MFSSGSMIVATPLFVKGLWIELKLSPHDFSEKRSMECNKLDQSLKFCENGPHNGNEGYQLQNRSYIMCLLI